MVYYRQMKPDEKKNYWQGAEPSESIHSGVDNQGLPLAEPDSPVVQGGVDVVGVQPRATPAMPEDVPVTWNAQEYIHAEKGPMWFVLFAFAVLAFIAVDVLFLKSWTFSVLVVVMAITLVMYIRRPARTLTYALSIQQGLYVGERLYPFDDFKSFGIIKDDGQYSIMMIPRKRFAPGVSVFFPQEVGEQIVDILGKRLPMEELKLDIIDIVVRKLRL